MYVNYADPFDLLYDYCLQNQLTITQYLKIYQQLYILCEQKNQLLIDQHYINQIEQYDRVTKTHEIADHYHVFLKHTFSQKNKDTLFIQFVDDNKDYFHYVSHYMLKLFYYLINSENIFYHQRYVSSKSHDKSISLRTLDPDLRYYINNMGYDDFDYHCHFDEHMPTLYIEKFYQYEQKDHNRDRKGRSLKGIISLDKQINRFLIMMTAFLCGRMTKKELNDILMIFQKIRPESYLLEEDDIVDFWIMNACDFVEKAIKICSNHNLVAQKAKDYLKMTRFIMLNDLYKSNDHQYINDLLNYFTHHTKLTYIQHQRKESNL